MSTDSVTGGARGNALLDIYSLEASLFEKTNQDLAQEIRTALSQNNRKTFNAPGSPSDYFEMSSYWDYAPEGAMLNWDYCLSRQLSKNEIIPYVFIGTETYAVLEELLGGDYDFKSNEFYSENDPSFHLKFKSEEAKQAWPKIKAEALGLQQEEVRFTRIISVVKNADDEVQFRQKLQSASSECGYSAVKIHEIVQLRDVPQNESEVRDQQDQWRALEDRFEDFFKIMDDGRKAKENVEVNCKAGRHRSAAIVAAYLMDRLGLSAEEALDYIRMQRGCVVDCSKSEFFPMLRLREK